jgi:RND family efflux transporter MFP subunit
VFAEYQVPLRGEPTSFAIHVTDLRDGTPKSAGAIILQGQLPSGVRSEITMDNPQSPGLYVSRLTFPQGGDWSVKVILPMAEDSVAIELGEVRVYESPESVAHARIPEPPEGVVLLKEQQWRLGVLTRIVTRQSLIERRIVPGLVRPQPGSASTLRAPLAGRLLPLPENPPLRPGQHVNSGQILALLEPSYSDLASQWAETEADWGRSRAELERFQAATARLRSLVAAEARSPRELEEAEADLAAAQAKFSATDQLRRSYRSPSLSSTNLAASLNALEIRAPIAGVVHTLHAGPGDLVASGQSLFDLADLDTVWIEARVPEFVVGAIPTPEDILVEVLDGSARVLPIASHHGQLLQLGVEVHPQQRTVPALYSWPNADSQLRLGQRLRIHLATAHARHSLAIPESALVEDAGQSIAFVQLDGEIFQRRELQLGVRDGLQVEVLAGLQEGERIVTHGAVVLRLAGAVGNIPEHGHSH